jgi:hypothetical protein
MRLFSCPEPTGGMTEFYDGGDHFMYLYDDGRIAGHSFEGGSIALTLEAAERYRNVLWRNIAAEQRRFEQLGTNIAKARSANMTTPDLPYAGPGSPLDE